MLNIIIWNGHKFTGHCLKKMDNYLLTSPFIPGQAKQNLQIQSNYFLEAKKVLGKKLFHLFCSLNFSIIKDKSIYYLDVAPDFYVL